MPLLTRLSYRLLHCRLLRHRRLYRLLYRLLYLYLRSLRLYGLLYLYLRLGGLFLLLQYDRRFRRLLRYRYFYTRFGCR